MKKVLSLALCLILCMAMLSVFTVSAEVEDLGQVTAMDFSGFEVGSHPGKLEEDVNDSPLVPEEYGKFGWDDGKGKNFDVQFTAEIISYEGGKALQWKNLVDGNTHTLYLNLAPDNLGKTDWTGATGVMFYLDTTQAANQVEVEFRLVEKSGDGLQAWCAWKDDAGTTLSDYYIWLNGKWTRPETTWGRAKLPQGYKGWVKMSLDESYLCLPWWSTPLMGAEGDKTLDLKDMYAVAIRAQSKAGDICILDQVAFIDDNSTTAAPTTAAPTDATTKKDDTKATTKAPDTKATTKKDDTKAPDKGDNAEDSDPTLVIVIVIVAVVVVAGAVVGFIFYKKKKK